MGEHRVIDINVASVEELALLVGVGRAKAESVIATRKTLVEFKSIDDLLLVPGIGRSLLEQNRNLLVCSVPSSAPVTRQASTRRSLRRVQEEGVGGGGSGQQAAVRVGKRGRELMPSRGERLSERLGDLVSDEENGSEEGDDGSSEYCECCSHNSDEEGAAAESEGGESDEISKVEGGEYGGEEGVLSGVGTDTPHEETPEDPFELSAILGGGVGEGGGDGGRERLLVGDEEEGEEDEEEDHQSNDGMSVDMHWDETLEANKKQNKRKSELSSDGKGCCPVKKSCQAVDSGESSSHNHCCAPVPSKNNRSMPAGLRSWLSRYHNWKPAQKLRALDSLIEACDLNQVRHIHQVILPQFQRDFISLLPKELALYVLTFLPPRDLLRAAQTCKTWNVLAADNLLWREKCRESGIEDHLAVMDRRRKRGTAGHVSPYKNIFMRQQCIESNWRNYDPNLRPPRVLKGHDDHVITCLQFGGTTIVSGSDDNTLKVWNAITGKCMRTLTGHTGGVWSSQMCGNIIVSGSTDRMLRVWNADTGDCLHTLNGHTSTVRCLHLHKNKVVSGSRDATLRVWDVVTGTCEHVLVGHVAAVRCVQYNGRLVVSGAYDYMVKVWNADREECLHTLQGHTNRVYSLQFDGVHVVSGSLDTSIRVWDVETGQCKHTLMGHQSLTSGMELKNNILISGNADSTVKVWDIVTGQCMQTLSGSNKHRSAVTCLQFNNKFVITSSDDGTVKLWDVRTGEFIRNLVALDSGGSGGVVWRIRASETKLVCAVGSRNGTEETKLLVLDFDPSKQEVVTTGGVK